MQINSAKLQRNSGSGNNSAAAPKPVAAAPAAAPTAPVDLLGDDLLGGNTAGGGNSSGNSSAFGDFGSAPAAAAFSEQQLSNQDFTDFTSGGSGGGGSSALKNFAFGAPPGAKTGNATDLIGGSAPGPAATQSQTGAAASLADDFFNSVNVSNNPPAAATTGPW